MYRIQDDIFLQPGAVVRGGKERQRQRSRTAPNFAGFDWFGGVSFLESVTPVGVSPCSGGKGRPCQRLRLVSWSLFALDGVFSRESGTPVRRRGPDNPASRGVYQEKAHQLARTGYVAFFRYPLFIHDVPVLRLYSTSSVVPQPFYL